MRKPLELSTGRPHGPRWDAYVKQLRWAWFRAGRPCYYCGHPFAAAQLIEVCHLVSPLIKPELAWSRDNLAPGHGPTKKTGNKRCPIPECNLNCNWLAHNSPDAPKDEDGADRPFTPEFLARQQRARAQFRGRNGKPAISREIQPEPPGNGDKHGRIW